ncbi:BlaI/MecI/CopY family transcriptional regulator [Actinomadura barringtoniae]|uniref:BlaI/MecI/CopY family transcriptional regulator n=1 Tax=Actinomadura barringtoniae TaxID=1427535 RepID=A0A939PNB5_9ACTN|nr:BlaI/MecI/CopY family transcriptional regulator [Actinomadura barringtoniae]MBO2453228.1 BlaI/MecI/CopY family transcriptional regulator [Actinomadura barringtoniae]
MTEPSERRASGALEGEVMQALQQAAEPLAAGDVQTRLSGDLSYSTVVTILSRMYAKGLLKRKKAGRAFVYSPVSDQPGLAALQMHRVMDSEPDSRAVLARFVSSLSEQDERILRDLLQDP